LQKAAFVVFVYSVILTGGISFLAVLLIPNDIRMKDYSDNLISGLAMSMAGPTTAKLLLNAFVVLVGFLILAGAVNTAIIGSNGVLNRVAEDGVMPEWFRKPHPRYGTSHRVLSLILILQLVIIVASKGDVLVLGEAYAFGVLWSFVFKALAMTVLRFRDRRPREFLVPFNIKIGDLQFLVGLLAILGILATTASFNFFTKEVATVSGMVFTLAFFAIFVGSEIYHDKGRHGKQHEHLEHFNQERAESVTPEELHLTKQYRKLVAIRSPHNLYMLEKALAETDPETTDVVIMTAKVAPVGTVPVDGPDLDRYDQQLMTAVVERAEKAGKEVKSIIVPTNNPLFAVIRTAKEINAQELIVGASNKYTADEQLDQVALYWINMNGGQAAPLTVRLLGRDRDVQFDLGGGNRIPKLSERRAKTVAELRAAGVGVDRVLLVHDGSQAGSDLFQAVLTMLDPLVVLGLVPTSTGGKLIDDDIQRAERLGRAVTLHPLSGTDIHAEVLRLASETKADLVILGLGLDPGATTTLSTEIQTLATQLTCRVFLATPPNLPQEPEETHPPEMQVAAPS
jgi:nucleotide-binding universal stress UspA family protein